MSIPPEDLRLIRKQAEAWREVAPLLARLDVLAKQRSWQLGRTLFECAVDDLERLEHVSEPRVALGALLWARNHIDVGVNPELRAAIVRRLDAILNHADVTLADLQAFQEAAPAAEYRPPTGFENPKPKPSLRDKPARSYPTDGRDP